MNDVEYFLNISNEYSKRTWISVGQAKASSRTAKKLFDEADEALAQRMLMLLALNETTRTRSRFTTDVLCQQGAEWAALPFARYGVTDSKKGWQERRLRAVENSIRSEELLEQSTTFHVGQVDSNFYIIEGDGGSDKKIVRFKDGAAELLTLVSRRKVKFCNETIVLNLDEFEGPEAELFVSELGATSKLWPTNIVAVGGMERIASTFERDKGGPNNIYWFLESKQGVSFLGHGDHIAPNLPAGTFSLDEAILLLQFASASKYFDLIPDESTRERLAEEYFKELPIQTSDMVGLPLSDRFRKAVDKQSKSQSQGKVDRV